MQIDIEKISEGQGVVLRPKFENLDAGNAKKFKETMQPHMDGYQTILLDMSALNFVDSSGLGAFLSCLRTMNNKGGQLKLFAMTKPVQALFELVRMHRVFAIYNSREEAVSAI